MAHRKRVIAAGIIRIPYKAGGHGAPRGRDPGRRGRRAEFRHGAIIKRLAYRGGQAASQSPSIWLQPLQHCSCFVQGSPSGRQQWKGVGLSSVSSQTSFMQHLRPPTLQLAPSYLQRIRFFFLASATGAAPATSAAMAPPASTPNRRRVHASNREPSNFSPPSLLSDKSRRRGGEEKVGKTARRRGGKTGVG